jgi:hypothetical protein
MNTATLLARGVYLDLRLTYELPGRVVTAKLMDRWQCSQATVSRRLSAIEQAGLATVWRSGKRGAYWVKPVRLNELREVPA